MGGGGVRCLLFDPESGRVHGASRPCPPVVVQGGAGLQVELDTGLVIDRMGEAVRAALAEAGAGPDDVVAVAATATRHAMVLVDSSGEVLLAASNRDARAALEAMELGEQHGAELLGVTGHWPTAIQPGPRLLQLLKAQPALIEQTAHVLSASDWLGFWMTGNAGYEASQASETLLFSLNQRGWCADWIARLGLPRDIFPDPLDAGSQLGELGPLAAEKLGLAEGTTVAVGAADSQSALLAAACVEAGELCAVTGSSLPVQLVMDVPVTDPDGALWTSHHAVPGLWVLESNGGPIGESLEWAARLLFADSPRPVERLFAEAAASVAGARGMLSSLGAHLIDWKSPGLPVGELLLSHLVGVPGDDPRRDVARALVEGMACGVRANAERVCDLSHNQPELLRVAGGMLRSSLWPELLAQVTDLPVHAASACESGAMGAALCAGAGVGVFADLAETAQAAPLAATVVAESADVATMLQVYGRWKGRAEQRPAADGDAVGALTTAMLEAGEAAGVAREKKLTPSLLVTAQFDEVSLARLARLGELEYSDFRSSMRLLTGAALVDALGDHDVFVTEVDLVDAAVLRDTPGLRVVVSCRNDPVNIDLDACSAFGVPVLNAPGRNAVAVADLAVLFMLSLARRSAAGGDFLRQPGSVAGDMGRMGQAFSLFRGAELWNLTVGLVGLGAVGREVARRLRGFGCRLLVSDPAVDAREAARHDAELLGLDELLERSDVVSLHAAVNDQTRGMINAERLAAMKPGAMLINTARAALVDEEALVEALRDGRLGGAGLDVFAEEPPASDHPLLAMDNVIATPHLGGNTAEIAVHQGRIIADELELMAAGGVPRHCLNPEVLADFDWSADRREPGDEEIAGLLAKAGPAVSDLQREKPGVDDVAADDAAVEDAAVEEDDKAADLSAVAADLREGMSRQLEAWGRAVSASEELAAEAENNQVTMQFELHDLSLTFYLQLTANGASAGLGAIAGGADVCLSMGAAIFDGMFGGELNAMEAAMDGRLSFIGDAGKAMTLQHLEPLLAVTYKAAREEVGDLGDLSALAALTTVEDGRSPGNGTAGPGDGGRAGSSDGDEAATALCEVVDELYASGLITATGGNVTTRVTAGADELWITPSQSFKGKLDLSQLVRIDLDGDPVVSGARSPSSERLMHAVVYRVKPEVEAVIHCHAPNATVLANSGLPFVPVSTEAAFFGEIPRVPFIMPGTVELADAVGEAMKDSWAVMLVNHGLLVAGRSLRRAADMASVIERSCEVILGSHAVGKPPPVLPDDVLEKLRNIGDMIA